MGLLLSPCYIWPHGVKNARFSSGLPLHGGRLSPRPCAAAETRFDVVVEVATAFAVATMTPATLCSLRDARMARAWGVQECLSSGARCDGVPQLGRSVDRPN